MTKKRHIIGMFNYADLPIPGDYKCDHCGADKVKLWINQLAENINILLCAKCSENHQKIGREDNWKSLFSVGEGVQIGWMTPAVPIGGEDAYWLFTSIPEEGMRWWEKLSVEKN